MYVIEEIAIPYFAVFAVPVSLGFVLMLKDTVVKILTFAKGLDLS